MKKIILINPPVSRKIFFSGGFPPLGLAYIASCIKEKHIVSILDMELEQTSEAEFINELKNGNYDVVGFTVSAHQFNNVTRLAALVKKESEAITIAGGPFPTSNPEDCINSGLDYVVRGEGEDIIMELLGSLDSPEQVKGISFEYNGKCVNNPLPDYISDIDTLPLPALELYPEFKRYYGEPITGQDRVTGNLVTSRGCPYNCSFCFMGRNSTDYRAHSVERVLKEWKRLVEDFKVDEIAVFDDAFAFDEQRAIRICEEIINRKLVVPWILPDGMRCDMVSERLLIKMKEAGCYKIALGVESGSQNILNSVSKNLTLDTVKDTFAMVSEAGIKTKAFFILGLPGETSESIKETIRFATELNPDYAQFTIAAPYPGTLLREQLLNKGILLTEDWENMDAFSGKAFFATSELPARKLEKLFSKAYRNFYLRPKKIVQLLKVHGSIGNILIRFPYFIKGLLKFF